MADIINEKSSKFKTKSQFKRNDGGGEMKVDKIIPCVCCDHEPDASDSIYYGMPHLKVCGGKPETFFEYYCPNCGRGNFGLQYKSAYLALKAWNDMQERLWKIKEMTEVEENDREKKID